MGEKSSIHQRPLSRALRDGCLMVGHFPFKPENPTRARCSCQQPGSQEVLLRIQRLPVKCKMTGLHCSKKNWTLIITAFNCQRLISKSAEVLTALQNNHFPCRRKRLYSVAQRSGTVGPLSVYGKENTGIFHVSLVASIALVRNGYMAPLQDQEPTIRSVPTCAKLGSQLPVTLGKSDRRWWSPVLLIRNWRSQ